MRKHLMATVILALVVVACSSDGGQPDPETFCDADSEIAVLDAPRDMSETSDAAKETIDKWLKNAPDEIQPQVEMWATRLTRLIDVWEAGDFDDAKIDQAEFEAAFDDFFAQDLDTASTEVDAWANENCTT